MNERQQQTGDDNMVEIWETLSSHFDCMWTLSINDINTESTSPHWIRMVDILEIRQVRLDGQRMPVDIHQLKVCCL